MLKRINFSNIHYVPYFSWWHRNRLKLAFNLGHVKGNFVTICVGKKLGKEVILPRAYSAPKVLVIEVRNWKHKMTWGPKPWVQIIYNGKNLEYGLLSRRVRTQFFCRMLFILIFCCLCNVSVISSASDCGSCVLSAGVCDCDNWWQRQPFVRGIDEGQTLETSAFKLFPVANLRFQLSC